MIHYIQQEDGRVEIQIAVRPETSLELSILQDMVQKNTVFLLREVDGCFVLRNPHIEKEFSSEAVGDQLLEVYIQ